MTYTFPPQMPPRQAAARRGGTHTGNSSERKIHGVYGSGCIAGGDVVEDDEALHGRQEAALALAGEEDTKHTSGDGNS